MCFIAVLASVQVVNFLFLSILFLCQKTETFCCITASGASKTRPSSTCLTNQRAQITSTLLFFFFSSKLSTYPLRAGYLATAGRTVGPEVCRTAASGNKTQSTWTRNSAKTSRNTPELNWSSYCSLDSVFSFFLSLFLPQVQRQISAPSGGTLSTLSPNQPITSLEHLWHHQAKY